METKTRVIAVLGAKGGIAKSTVATNLAGTLKGFTTIIDLDPQGSAMVWAKNREQMGVLPKVWAAQGTADNLAILIAKAKKNGVDWVVIDTSPRSDADVLEAAKHANLILIPTLVGLYDVRSVKVTLRLLQSFDVPKFVVLGKVRTVFGFQRREARAVEAIAAYGGVLAKVRFSDAVAFEEAPIEGKTAYEYDKRSKAGKQVLALTEFAMTSVGA